MRPEDTTPTLISRIAQQSCESSFRMFFERFYNGLFELAMYYTRNQAVAEEVVSDVFLKVWTQRTRLEEIRDIRAYLFVAIKRQSLNALRNTPPVSLYVQDLEHHVVVESRTPEKIMFSQETLSAISRAVQNLPEKCRMVYHLVKEERLKYKEVASLLNLSEKTVEMHVSHALKKIRKEMEQFERESQSAESLPRSISLGLLTLLSTLL